MKKDSEEILLEKLNDPALRREAFSGLVNEYGEKLYWHIRKLVLTHDDTNDVLQNTFIKAWLNLDKFRGDAKLLTWLYRIAVNESITFLNKQRLISGYTVNEGDTSMLDRLESDSYFDGDEAELKLQEAILRLPEKQRIVFTMRYYDDLKYEEISEILGTSEGALKASYHHAVKKVTSFLTDED